LNKFTKAELKTHLCSADEAKAEKSLSCCRLSGVCDPSVSKMTSHALICRKLGMPMLDLEEFCQHVTTLPAKRSRKRTAAKTGQDTVCHDCGIILADYAELALHTAAKKCESHECKDCGQSYANRRTLSKHDCCRDDVIQVQMSSDMNETVIKPFIFPPSSLYLACEVSRLRITAAQLRRSANPSNTKCQMSSLRQCLPN